VLAWPGAVRDKVRARVEEQLRTLTEEAKRLI
jgi:hypothetical protein